MKTDKELILERLKGSQALALHEFKIPGISESALGARLRELTREGKTVREFRKGERFKQWQLAPDPEPVQLEAFNQLAGYP